MNEIDIALKELKLSNDEQRILTFILNNVEVKGSDVIREIRIDKSAFYRSIKKLLGSGVVVSSGTLRNQRFSISTDVLVNLSRSHREKVSDITRNFEKFVQEVSKQKSNNGLSQKIKIIEGREAYNNWAEDKLTMKRGEVIRDLVSRKNNPSYIDDYENVTIKRLEKRVKLGIIKKVLISSSELPILDRDKSSDELLKFVRVLPKDFRFNAYISTYGEKTSFFRVDKGVMSTVIIEDRFITELMNSFYDFVWEYSKKI